MELERVRSYPTPGYPTAKEFHELEKLTQYMPRRWRAKRLVGQILLFVALSGLDFWHGKNTQSYPWVPTEADAYHFLQSHRSASAYTIPTADMPHWHCPEDWERDVEEYRMAHPTIGELSHEEALTILANWLITKES